MGVEMKCSLLQTSDKKLWLLLKKANCTDRTPSKDNNQSSSVVQSSEEVISYPNVELWRHCLLRGANLGSLVSIVCGTPVLLYKGVRQPSALLHRLAGISTYGVGCGIILAAALTVRMTWGMSEEQIYDRSYRLRYNKGQVLMDKMSYTGVMGGGVAGALSSPKSWGTGSVKGACLGLGLAVFAQMLLKPMLISKE